MSGEIFVSGVGKAYRHWGSEWKRFAKWFGANPRPDAETWVLRGIDFKVARGEAVGIIGQNGAGKSTLLKLVTGTARPTEGAIHLTGRVAAILELGMGFNPELSGRENVRHAAGLLGFSGEDIERIVPEVEKFAEIGSYFDEPVRAYSSGMQVRVAFSVATATRPDILIVDEALSVGDAYFVHKCFQRIRDFRAAGTTLLFVSHDPTAVQALCDRAILLVAGKKVLDGEPREVFDYYNALIAEKENSKLLTVREEGGPVQTVSGTGEAGFGSITLRNSAGEAVEYVGVGEAVSLDVVVEIHEPIERLVFGYMIRDRLGQPIYGTNTHYSEQVLGDLSPGQRIRFSVSFHINLGPGSYSVSVALSSTETHLVKNFQWRDLATVFQVANITHQHFVGSAWLPSRIEWQEEATDDAIEVRTME